MKVPRPFLCSPSRLLQTTWLPAVLAVVAAACGNESATPIFDVAPLDVADTADTGGEFPDPDGGDGADAELDTDLDADVDDDSGQACRPTGNCGEGRVCDPDLGECVDIECVTDNDCATGSICIGSLCEPQAVCLPGAARCDGNTILRCAPDGLSEVPESCGDLGVCVVTDEDAFCQAVVCEPGESGCVDAATSYTCGPTGATVSQTVCDAGSFCVDAEGVCREAVCEPLSRTCDGTSVVVCGDRGTVLGVENCADFAACADSAAGCGCRNGACAARLCVPGASRCVGNAFQTCADDGFSWLPAVACAGEQECLAGACLDASCEAGSTSCVGDQLLICEADGRTRTVVDCTPLGLICATPGGVAACDDPICEAGSRECAVGAEAVVICDPRGASISVQSCGAGQYCSDGACLAQVCVPGAAPVCAGNSVRVCSDRGDSLVTVETCAAGVSRCAGGDCVPLDCTPNTSVCRGEVLEVCDAEGAIAAETDCARTGGFCEAGACLPRVCVPGSGAVCLDGDVVACSDRGDQYELLQNCGGSGCTAGACLSVCGDGVLEGGEQCDDGAANGVAGACSTDCLINTPALCAGLDPAFCVLTDDAGEATVVFEATLGTGPVDVVVNVDTTGSMSSPIAAIRTAFSSVIVPTLSAEYDDVGFAVTDFQEFPCASSTLDTDRPFRLFQRITTAASSAQAALNALELGGGGDLPETGWESLYQIATGNGRIEPTCPSNTSAFDSSVGRIAGVADGELGGVGFRDGSRRMVVHVTDAISHQKGDSAYPWGATRLESEEMLRRNGIRVLPVISSTSEAADADAMALGTGAVVPVCAWDDARPAGCGTGQCCTGPLGAGVAPVGGECPLSFTVGTTADNIPDVLLESIGLMLQYGRWDVSAIVRPDPVELALTGFDTSCLIRSTTVVGATPAPGGCIPDPEFEVRADRTIVHNMTEGGTLDFQFEIDRGCVPASDRVQSYVAWLDVVSQDGHRLGTQELRVVVPPTASCDDCLARCGDGVVTGTEACDDGNTDNTDGCTNSCQAARCGDGLLQYDDSAATTVNSPLIALGTSTHACDDGATCPQSSCDVEYNPFAAEHGLCQALGYARATQVVWGYGTDDVGNSNTASMTDCFDYSCDSTSASAAACSNWEMLATLGCRGRVEECDNGALNANLPNRCRANCTLPGCGDGILDAGEMCDDGNRINTDACRNTCRAPSCGDGVVDADEACDDGNLTSGDGCGADCRADLAALPCVDEELGYTMGVPVTAGITSGASDRSLSCGAGTFDAPDYVVRFVAPRTGTYQIDTENSVYDTVLEIRRFGTTGFECSGNAIACDDNSGIGNTSSLVAELTADTQYFIIVDGYNAASGAFVLNIQQVE